jgi:hypothetical protein
MPGFLIHSGTELRHGPDAAADQGDHERKGDALTFGHISEPHRTLLFALDAIWLVEIADCRYLMTHGHQQTKAARPTFLIDGSSAMGPECVKTFFLSQNCTQPGNIRVDTTV